MNKYIDTEKLIVEIKRKIESIENCPFQLASFGEEKKSEGELIAYKDALSLIASLQQEQLETDVKSPFTGGKVAILSREEEVTFRGEKVKITRKYYRCEDTGREFTDDKLDDDMMWTAFRTYCEKKGMTSFTDIMLKQEQPEVDLEKELNEWMKYGPHTCYPWCTIPDAIKITAEHFYELGRARKEE